MAAISSLSAVCSRLQTDFKLSPVLAAEIEFYLPGMASIATKEAAVEKIQHVLAGLPVAKVDAEAGLDQFEVSFQPSRNAQEVIDVVAHFKTRMQVDGIKADFAAKPFAEQPGSGLHIHMNLLDEAGHNCFTRAGRDMEDPFSDELRYTVGGLMAFMNPSMKFFAPSEESYSRFTKGANAPVTVSWGTNNRTVAVRLPTKALDDKHIEHRVAGSDADITQVLWAILSGAHYGLSRKADPGEPIYGDAALAQYNLPRLAGSLAEAEDFYNACTALQAYI